MPSTEKSPSPSSGWTAFGATLEASRQKSQPSIPVAGAGVDPLDATAPAGGSKVIPAVAADTVADAGPPSLVASPVKPSGGAGLKVAIGAAALIIVGGAAAAIVMRGKTAPPIEAVVPSKPTQPTVVTPPPQTEKPKPAASTLVLVDSEPEGASIIRDGRILGETPDTIPVEDGHPISVVLKKEGYADESVVIDPAKGRKLSFRLERLKHESGKSLSKSKSGPASKVGKLPAAPPPPTPDPPHAAPHVTPPPVTPPPQMQAPVKKKVVDPYERLDDGPPKGNRKGEVLNPY